MLQWTEVEAGVGAPMPAAAWPVGWSSSEQREGMLRTSSGQRWLVEFAAAGGVRGPAAGGVLGWRLAGGRAGGRREAGPAAGGLQGQRRTGGRAGGRREARPAASRR
jgi:hypothetical protein